MNSRTQYLVHLSRLWLERAQPEGRAPRDALLLAENLATIQGMDSAALALAWRTVASMFGVLGWEISISPELARCRSAADSARLTAWKTLEKVLEAVPADSPPVLLLGELGLAAAVLGEWDVLPAAGALLVPLEGGREEDASATDLAAAVGVRWVKPGRLTREISEDLPSTEIEGRTFRLPSPTLTALLSSKGAAAGRSPDVIFFSAAWAKIGAASPEVQRVPGPVPHRDRITAAAWRLGLLREPGLAARLRFRLRTLVPIH